jgi:hypothetical protein
VIILGLLLAGGAALVIAGLVQGDLDMGLFGGVLLIFCLWGLAAGGPGRDPDGGDAGDGDA